jgi:hypothetical protein
MVNIDIRLCVDWAWLVAEACGGGDSWAGSSLERENEILLYGCGVWGSRPVRGAFLLAVLVVDDCLKSRLSRAVGCCFLLLFCVTLSACGAFAKQQPILLVHVRDPDPVLSASMQIVRLSESSAPTNRAIITTNASRDLLLIEI